MLINELFLNYSIYYNNFSVICQAKKAFQINCIRSRFEIDYFFTVPATKAWSTTFQPSDNLNYKTSESVVGTAAQMHGNPLTKGGKTGFNRGSDRTPGTLNESRGPGKPDAPDFPGG